MAGAPKGNTNALKHGLYARHFNDDQRAGLRRMAWDDHRHEVNALRTIGEQIYIRLSALFSANPDIDQVARLTNTFTFVTTATGTSARTHGLLNGQDTSLGDALSEALGDVPAFCDERTD